MQNNVILPKKISVFPLSNFIIFPKTTVPLNIFEPRYLQMVDESMDTNKIIGLIQPKQTKTNTIDDLYNIGCLGKITRFKKEAENNYLIDLTGVSRFEIIKEINNNKPYRECEVSFQNFEYDIKPNKEELKFSDLELIFKDLKSLFDKRGYIINWKSLEKQNLNETINALAMASPFSLEEKQALLESENLVIRKTRIAEILKTYTFDNYHNVTIQ